MKRIPLLFVLLLTLTTIIINAHGATVSDSNYTVSRVADIASGAADSDPDYLTEYDGKLYFVADDDSTYGRELWVYDGVNPPSVAYDINTGINSSWPEYLAVFNGKLYFSANDGSSSWELWQFDGITASPVYDICSGCGSYPKYLTVYNNKLYFSADDGTHGEELWVYDGTNSPYMLQDFYPGSGGVSPSFLTVYKNKLYYSGYAADYLGRELMVFYESGLSGYVDDINPGVYNSNPSYLTVFNEKLYFAAERPDCGTELWEYDDESDPQLSADIITGSDGSSPLFLYVHDNLLFFRASDGTHGEELWKYDGETSPAMVADILIGDSGSSPHGFTEFNGNLFYTAWNGSITSQELWKYDGENTPVIAANINPASSSIPDNHFVYDGKLYFSADDGSTGRELWVYEPIINREMFYSQSTYDGWVLETGENTNKGGLINTTNLLCNIGDDALNRQYRTILHFNTSRIPDDAVITKVTLQVKEHSWVGDPPYLTLGNFVTDIKQGFFSNNPALVKSDFAAAPSIAYAGTFQLTPSSLAYPLFIASVKSSALQYLNLAGITQFRLRYAVDDNNNLQADYIKIFCGDMPVPFNRPVLRVWYYVP